MNTFTLAARASGSVTQGIELSFCSHAKLCLSEVATLHSDDLHRSSLGAMLLLLYVNSGKEGSKSPRVRFADHAKRLETTKGRAIQQEFDDIQW